MVALQLVPTESIAWLQLLCWTCRLSEWFSGGYGQGRCLEFCPFEGYRATLNIETWRALTIEAQPPNVTAPSVTAPPVEASMFDETTTTTDGWADSMPYTIHVDTTGSSASSSIISNAIVVYVRTEQQGPATGFFMGCQFILWSFLLILWDLPLILMRIAFQPLDTCKLFGLGVYEVFMAFISGVDADTLRLDVALAMVALLLFVVFSVAVALPGRAKKSSRFGVGKKSSHKSQQTDFPFSDQIMRLQTQDQETQTSRDGLQEELDNAIEEKKLLNDMNNDNLKKVNARIVELQAQLEREQAETKKAKDERKAKENRILGLEADLKEEQELLEKTNSSKKTLRDAHQNELKTLQETHLAALTDVQERHKAQLSEVHVGNDQQLTQLRATHEANTSEMPAAYESKITALKSTHDEELEKIESDQESTRMSRDEVQGQLAQLKATHESELDEAQKASEKAKRDLEATHKLKLDNVRNEAGKELTQLKATHAEEKMVLEQSARDARTARENEIEEQKAHVNQLKLELDNEKAETSQAKRQAAQQAAEINRIRKVFKDQEKAAKATEDELKEAKRDAKRLQYELDQMEGSSSTEARQREETESRLKQEVLNRNTANLALQTKTWELRQAREEIARLRLQLKGSADEQPGSSVPEKSSAPEESAVVEESTVAEENPVAEEESFNDSLFDYSSADLDPVLETQEASVYALPEEKVDTVDSGAISAQLSSMRASNHVLKRVELEPISLLVDLNPPFQSVLEQHETRIIGSQKGALIINSDPRRPDYYLRGDSFDARHVEKMNTLDRAMRDKTNERFGLVEIADRSKEGGYRYSQRSGFVGSRRRKSITFGDTDASMLAEVGWRVPDRGRSVFKEAQWSSGFSAQGMLERKRMNGSEFEKKMGMKGGRVLDLASHMHRNPTDALFTAKPASTLFNNGQGSTSLASLTDILGLEDLRQQQIDRGHATQFSRLSSNAFLDKSRSIWSKRHAGDLMSAKEVRVELFMKYNNEFNATKRAQNKKISSTSGSAITGANNPSLAAGKASGTPAAPSKSNGMYASRYAHSTTSSGSRMQTQADGPGVSSNVPSPAPPASGAPKKGNSMNDNKYAQPSTPAASGLPTKASGGLSSSSTFNPSATSFTPSVSAKKSDVDSSKSAPSWTPSAPTAPTKPCNLNDGKSVPSSPAPSVPSAPTKKVDGLSASMYAIPSASSVSSPSAATKGGLSTSKPADTSTTSVPSSPKKANGMMSSRYATASTQSSSTPPAEKASDLSGDKSAPSSNASASTPTTKKTNDMYSSRYASPPKTSVSTPTTKKESDLNESKPAPSCNTSVPTAPKRKANDMYSSRYATLSTVETSSVAVAAGTTSNSSAGAAPSAPRAQGQSGNFNAGQWGGTFNLNYAHDPNEASESEDSIPRGRGRGGRGRGRGMDGRRGRGARGRYNGRRG